MVSGVRCRAVKIHTLGPSLLSQRDVATPTYSHSTSAPAAGAGFVLEAAAAAPGSSATNVAAVVVRKGGGARSC